jgi:putative pyruvate formate lyase activating enzyme
MIAMEARPRSERRAVAASRIEGTGASLAHCEVCARRCGVDRRRGPAGICGAASAPRIFSAQMEVGDELELIPAFAIALSGCNIRCAFCITGDESWHAARGASFATVELAARAADALESGAAKTILILGGEPTIHLPWLVEFVALLPDDARLVLKTNGLCTEPARELLDGLFDVWLVDWKFGSDDCARKLSQTPGYRAALEETLVWADGRADLIVRHLLMPGHVECCWKPAAEWLAEHLPATKVSLRFGYWPAWKAARIPGLDRAVTCAEQAAALAIADACGLNLIA